MDTSEGTETVEQQESLDLIGPTQADEIDENDENMDTSNVQESTDATNQAEAGEEENAAAGDIIKEKMHKFPLGTIKKIMKMDPDVNMASKDAIYLVTKSLEMFVESLAIEAYSNTVNAKKKTISRQDVEKAIDAEDKLGWTALGLAAMHGNADMVCALLENGATPMRSQRVAIQTLLVDGGDKRQAKHSSCAIC